MTEMFPGQYPAGDQKQETPETGHLATTGESQGDSLPANSEVLREGKDKLLGDMGSSALEASGVASPEGDASQDSSGPPKTLSPDRKSTRLNSSHTMISYAVFCLKKKKK